MPRFIIDLELDGYETTEEEYDACLDFIEEQLNITASSVTINNDDEIETLRLQLASCGVAAQQNTKKTIADRIDKDNKYWSASYGDICNAIDREIILRNRIEKLRGLVRFFSECHMHTFCSRCDFSGALKADDEANNE